MLKSVAYRLADSSMGCGVYWIDRPNRHCVYSGITHPGSSINYAEDIINAICRQEKINPRLINFFDLQTCLGYKKQPGEFEYEKIILTGSENDIYASFWEPAPCPEEVVRIFSDLIQGKQP